jgi:hypothetical protein
MYSGDVAYYTVDSLSAFWPGLQVLAGDVQNAIKLHMICWFIHCFQSFKINALRQITIYGNNILGYPKFTTQASNRPHLITIHYDQVVVL